MIGTNLSTVSSINIRSLNCNSIGKNPTRSKTFEYIRKKKTDIFVAIDTRIDKSIENTIRTEWQGECFFNSLNSQSRGVAIFCRKNLPIKILGHSSDNSGNILSLHFEFNAKIFLLIAIYGPNNDDANFYGNSVFTLLNNQNFDYSVLCGDWNLTLNQSIDNYNYVNINNPNAKQKVIDSMNSENLCDIYRDLNPDSKRYTWTKSNPIKLARLDFFLISNHLSPYISKADIEPGFQSDHSIITLEIDIAKVSLGRGFFKFNNSLLKDTVYIDLVHKKYREITKQYANEALTAEEWQNMNLNEFQNVGLNINSQLFFDVFLMEVRGLTIQYSSIKKRTRLAREQYLLHELEVKELEFQSSPNNPLFKNSLDEINNQVDYFISEANKNAYNSFKSRYALDGEKPSSFFMNLEKNSSSQNYISKLRVTQNDRHIEINSQTEIEKEIFRFYRDLYDEKETKNDSIEEFLGETNISFKKFSENQKQSMEGLLTEGEVGKYLKKLKNNKSPGSSGFTGEFYKMFWINIKKRILDSMNYCFETGTLPKSQNLGVIKLIPKGEKDKTYLKNWRPLALLSTFYKCISGCISERMKGNLDDIISSSQKAYLSNRFIGEATRTTFDTLSVARENNLQGVLLLIDFQKCFDTVSHKLIKKALVFFNFGPDMIKWIHLLLDNFFACIVHAGNISSRFRLKRGVKQGDPCSSLLFLLIAEILAFKIKNEPGITGFKLGNLNNILEQYADDLQCFLQAFDDDRLTENNIRALVTVFEKFYEISGLKANMDKTFACWFGTKSNYDRQLCPDLNLKWTTHFESLGIVFDNNLQEMDKNFTKVYASIRKLLNSWKHRYLTPFGKIIIIKSLALSKLTHLALVLPNLDPIKIQEIEKLFYNFLWNEKPNVVSTAHAVLPARKGGLNMVSVTEFWKSIKISWIRRLFSSDSFWCKILNFELSKINTSISDLLKMGDSGFSKCASQIKNPFWKETFNSCADIIELSFFHTPENFLYFPVVENSLFTIGENTINSNYFGRKNFLQVADLYVCDTLIFKELNLFNREQNINLNFLQFESLKRSIKGGASKLNFNIALSSSFFRPTRLLTCIITLNKPKGCQQYYKIFMSRHFIQNNTSEIEKKWHNDLNTILSIDSWNIYWNFVSKLKYFNDIKWLQLRILRRCLKTNHIVSRFNNDVTDICTFCGIPEETISHLFFKCNLVNIFWNEIENFFLAKNIEITFNRNTKLFGNLKFSVDNKENMIPLFAKHFIWISRFRKIPISLANFKKYLKDKLDTLKSVFISKNCLHLFEDQWETVLILLQDQIQQVLP